GEARFRRLVAPVDSTVSEPATEGAAAELARHSRHVDLATAAVDLADGDAPALPRGTRVRYFGDYELQGLLGEGGMGVVYRAKPLASNRLVALKMIRAANWAGDDEVRRFRNEAEAIAGLDHPRIVPIYEIGSLDGQHYFSMKLVGESSLAGQLSRFV